jgi:hypothetical protein
LEPRGGAEEDDVMYLVPCVPIYFKQAEAHQGGPAICLLDFEGFLPEGLFIHLVLHGHAQGLWEPPSFAGLTVDLPYFSQALDSLVTIKLVVRRAQHQIQAQWVVPPGDQSRADGAALEFTLRLQECVRRVVSRRWPRNVEWALRLPCREDPTGAHTVDLARQLLPAFRKGRSQAVLRVGRRDLLVDLGQFAAWRQALVAPRSPPPSGALSGGGGRGTGPGLKAPSSLPDLDEGLIGLAETKLLEEGWGAEDEAPEAVDSMPEVSTAAGEGTGEGGAFLYGASEEVQYFDQQVNGWISRAQIAGRLRLEGGQELYVVRYQRGKALATDKRCPPQRLRKHESGDRLADPRPLLTGAVTPKSRGRKGHGKRRFLSALP